MSGLFQAPITIVLFLVVLAVLVLVHEVGHFVIARLAKVRVLEFGLGFPPRARILRRSGETLYTLNWLPIGGFVKLEGEDGDSTDPRSFVNAALPVKLLILVAGVVMNLALAFVVFFGIAWAGDPALGVGFDRTQPGSPAEQSGLAPGMVLVGLNGRLYSAFEQGNLLTDLRTMPGQTVRLTLRDQDGGYRDVYVALRPIEQIDDKHGALGIEGARLRPTSLSIPHDAAAAAGLALGRTVSAFALVLDGLGQLVESIVRDPTSAPPVTGPIGIAVQVGDVFWQLGPIFLLYLVGLLSANLALVNILPFPPLDGGRIAVLVLQRLVGNRISRTAERLTYLVGFLILMGFLIWVSVFDVARYGGAP